MLNVTIVLFCLSVRLFHFAMSLFKAIISCISLGSFIYDYLSLYTSLKQPLIDKFFALENDYLLILVVILCSHVTYLN